MTSKHPSQVSLRQFAIGLFDGAASGYDRIAQILSYGQYLRWQRALIQQAVHHGIHHHSTVLDVATGTAGVAIQLIGKSGCRIVGLDQSPGMLATARHKLVSAPSAVSDRIDLIEATANYLPFPDDHFDAVIFTYLFRYVEDPSLTMRELVRVARPGAFVGFVEFHVPPSPWKQLWYLHTRGVLPLAGRLISTGWYEVGKFLGPSIDRFYMSWDISSLRTMLETSGVQDVNYRLMSLGGGVVMWGRKRDT
jgi:demethylmenaquinone methyltransferase / 2-methoxy-6-polyprenyl-1,4-benzoquinol methylase